MLAIDVEPDSFHVLDDLNARLVADNVAKAPDWGGMPFLVTARDAGGALAGGLRGVPNMGACEVRALWVEPQARGGVGRRLMEALSAEAVRRGCTMLFLDTYVFQARGFYEKLGFAVFAELDYPNGTRRFWMRKMVG